MFTAAVSWQGASSAGRLEGLLICCRQVHSLLVLALLASCRPRAVGRTLQQRWWQYS